MMDMYVLVDGSISFAKFVLCSYIGLIVKILIDCYMVCLKESYKHSEMV